ncbi:bacillithiol biosynthesis BshC, partial [Staphylococcus aureus]|uniref:bacillithiol biosynthesis protein BshC n=1 Tax=Staphylococcus aureus TaxID=1280 RepID=UPI001E57A0B3
KDLAEGAKVVIGGQQAGLFGGPLYTFQKIFSIITLSNQLTNQYNEKIIPVFWIAGEDHDFDEVNHTFVFNHKKATLDKIKYHTMTPPETSVTRFTPDKEALLESLNKIFKELTETSHSNEVYQLCRSIILRYENWTDIFK